IHEEIQDESRCPTRRGHEGLCRGAAGAARSHRRAQEIPGDQPRLREPARYEADQHAIALGDNEARPAGLKISRRELLARHRAADAEHLAHAGPALRTLVTDHHAVAFLDLAADDRREGVLFAI